jgi:hypothetical protein
VGLILDLAVVALALVVIGSLAVLAWTLAVSASKAVERQRVLIAERRQSIADAEIRLRTSAERASTTLAGLVRRTRPATSVATESDSSPGDSPDA